MALDTGLEIHPLAYELVEAKYVATARRERSKGGARRSSRPSPRRIPKGPFRRLLVEKCREQKEYDRAELLLSELHQEFPDESNLAAALVQVVSLEGGRGRGEEPGRPPGASSMDG